MTNAHLIKTTLSLAVTQLKAQGFETETAKLEAQMLLQQALNVNRAWLIAHQDENLPPSIDEAYGAKTHHAVIPPSKVFLLGIKKPKTIMQAKRNKLRKHFALARRNQNLPNPRR